LDGHVDLGVSREGRRGAGGSERRREELRGAAVS